jgi:GNAT superfamily N-acetyltransferase
MVTADAVEIRPFGADDDIEAELDLRRRSFGPLTAAIRPAWVAGLHRSIESGQMLAAFDGTRLVATARFHAMGQWWHGRQMPMAGVAGVKVAPEARGRGVGRALLTRLLADIADRGYPVSALFPTTLPPYRALGWEIAGGKYETELPTRSLAALARPDKDAAADAPGLAGSVTAGPVTDADPPGLRRATAADSAAIVQIFSRVHEALRDCGPNTRPPADLTDWLDDEDNFAYLADDGCLSYRFARGTSELQVDCLAAASAATARAFWQILSSHATMAETVRACLAPADPVSWLLTEPAAVTTLAESWMLRLVDPAAAISARGYPAAAALSVGLELADPVLPRNSGRWALEISGGEGRLAAVPESRRASPGPAVRLGARGFAALFAGIPAGSLRLAGLMAGGSPAADEALDCAFAGSAFMVDYF